MKKIKIFCKKNNNTYNTKQVKIKHQTSKNTTPNK